MNFAVICLSLACPVFSGELIIPPVNLPELPNLNFRPPAQELVIAPKPVKQVVDTHALIHAAAARHKVPVAIVKSIVAVESNFDCDAVSSRGAIGLMQLMPATAQEYGADPTIPEQNIDAGTRYIKVLMKRYAKCRNWLHRVIAAYNAGPAVVDMAFGVELPGPRKIICVKKAS